MCSLHGAPVAKQQISTEKDTDLAVDVILAVFQVAVSIARPVSVNMFAFAEGGLPRQCFEQSLIVRGCGQIDTPASAVI